MDATNERNRIRANLARRVTEMFGEARAVAVASELDHISDMIARVRQLRPAEFESLAPDREEQ